MEKIVEHMLAGMSDEEKQSMIKNIMPKVMENINIAEMMPEMMKNCMNNMSSEEIMKTMHEVMPTMMDNCLSSMTKQEREKMFTFCHTMLKEMEEKFL
jgi:Mg/Co/Ni transporter MgtE